MAKKTIKNKTYNEFWEDDKLNINGENKSDGSIEPKKAEPKKAEPKEAKPKKTETKKVEPKEAEPKEVEPKKVETKKVETKEVETKKAETKKAETKKAETKKVETKEVEPKEVEPKEAEPKEVEEEIVKVVNVIQDNNVTLPSNRLTEKQIYNDYVNKGISFRIFLRGSVIFDSKTQPKKNYPIFNENGFILFNKSYIYRGIRIEKY